MDNTLDGKAKGLSEYRIPDIEMKVEGLPSITATWGGVANFLPESGTKPKFTFLEANDENTTK